MTDKGCVKIGEPLAAALSLAIQLLLQMCLRSPSAPQADKAWSLPLSLPQVHFFLAADFGLARTYGMPPQPMTPKVVTLW